MGSGVDYSLPFELATLFVTIGLSDRFFKARKSSFRIELFDERRDAIDGLGQILILRPPATHTRR